MSRIYENGVVSSTAGGDDFLSNDVFITGDVQWVDSVNGNDANAGTEELPVASIAQSITNSTANNGDIVIVKSGHTETIGTGETITMSKAGVRRSIIFPLPSSPHWVPRTTQFPMGYLKSRIIIPATSVDFY